MGRSRDRERYYQKLGKAEKRAALGQMYGMGDVKVAQIVGEYPPKDYVKEGIGDEARDDRSGDAGH